MAASAVLMDGNKQSWMRQLWDGNRPLALMTGASVGMVWTAGLAYLGLVATLTWQALRGQSVVAPDDLTLAVLGGLALAAGVAAVVIVRRRG